MKHRNKGKESLDKKTANLVTRILRNHKKRISKSDRSINFPNMRPRSAYSIINKY